MLRPFSCTSQTNRRLRLPFGRELQNTHKSNMEDTAVTACTHIRKSLMASSDYRYLERRSYFDRCASSRVPAAPQSRCCRRWKWTCRSRWMGLPRTSGRRGSEPIRRSETIHTLIPRHTNPQTRVQPINEGYLMQKWHLKPHIYA